LKKHVEEELNWEPSVDEAAIGVSVKDAIVTLRGHVRSYSEKSAAERAVLRIHGVNAVVSELEVTLLGHERTDEDIAQAAANALLWNSLLPKEAVKVKVSRGWVTLSGIVEWQYQRATAEQAVSDLFGVKGVTNDVQVKPKRMPTSTEVKAGIEAALKRSAEVEAQRIHVETRGSTVMLTGTVYTWPERSAAEKAAWAAPGVSKVQNDITVSTALASASL
jgi:osmotically-inducible protein OsmY